MRQADVEFTVRTDLALEDGERIRESGTEVHGVVLEEEEKEETGIRITRVKIETKNGAKIMGKPVGTYLTLSRTRSISERFPWNWQGSFAALSRIGKRKNPSLWWGLETGR